ncbi:unnamed protein product (macronuclear) [Paramecium tetraurelia]|uniref:Uncharacterized protein n=1 Tax=Paramecium tetraurelia TaxID=5888 RepID=A0C3C3_PARTE|nr:uncharacterized protein GSPATT00034769001 [Paramecium tetraurelia]CAK65290.1 unnamed protein product [Paramecium tetraurelia]|eukprot:XP_001432687.1 hypothetical protein (macronuclear) [Paramecium tetraurelia strain d4-2]
MGQSCCNKQTVELSNEQMTDWCQNIEGVNFCENLDDIIHSNDFNSNHGRILSSQIIFTFQQQPPPTLSQESSCYEKMNSIQKQNLDEDSPTFKGQRCLLSEK